MIYPQNQIGLRKKIEAVDGAEYTTTLGPQWEHFDMLSTVPGLDDLQVRKAIATAMPRQQIVDRVVKDANDNAEVLNNTQYMVNQTPQYVPNWNIYPAAGRRRRGQRHPRRRRLDPGSDGVRQKGKTKLAFTVGTTSGNQARILVRADHAAAAREDRREAHDQELAEHPRRQHGRLRLRDADLRLGRRPRPVHRQRDLAVVGDPGAVLEATGQGRRVRLLGPELHEDQGPAGRRRS